MIDLDQSFAFDLQNRIGAVIVKDPDDDLEATGDESAQVAATVDAGHRETVVPSPHQIEQKPIQSCGRYRRIVDIQNVGPDFLCTADRHGGAFRFHNDLLRNDL